CCLKKLRSGGHNRAVSAVLDTIAYRFLPNLNSDREFAPPFSPAEAQVAPGLPSGEAILFSSCSLSMRGRLASVGAIAGGALALPAWAPATPVVLAGPQPEAVVAPAPHANTELGKRIGSAPELVVAGERLNVGLLRRFYAGHGFEPIWTTR